MKRESAFLTSIRKSFEAQGHFYFKMPDAPHLPGQARFDIKKPFDAFACVEGHALAIEAKSFDGLQCVALRHFRENQVEGLTKWDKSKGLAFAFVHFKLGRGKEGFYAIPWPLMLKKGRFVALELESMPRFEKKTSEELYDLSQFFDGLHFY